MNNIIDQVEAQKFIKNLSGKTKFIISKNSRALGVSRQTYQNKLDSLRVQKIIKNFTININPNIRPNALKYVMMEIKTNPKEPKLVKELLDIPQLRMLDGIIGDFSLFALFVFKSPEEYYQILNNIDKIMAKSYFKKYQIIDTIKIFKTNGISLKNLKVTKLDDIDYKILNILRENQGLKPISTYEIRNIFEEKLQNEISQSTIHNRIKKLEEQDAILNYTINFCPKKIGIEGKYLLRIKPKDPSKYSELAFKLDMNKNITDLFRIGEQYGLFAIVRVKKIEDYASFIRDLYSTEEIEDTYTNFVLDELKSYINFLLF
ncbi:MAG: Lrp/AsnC ligand binding domain-containing protein [Candidatus Odinarchaeota archaeon]